MTTNEPLPTEDVETDVTDALLDVIGSGALDDLDLNSGNVDPVLRELLEIRHDAND
jgi:hypothetical protein